MNDNHRHINEDVKRILLRGRNSEDAFQGTVLEGKERRYTVVNERDRKEYLSPAENAEFEQMLQVYLEKIEEGRAAAGKDSYNSYLVINIDEPYAEEIAAVMKRNGHLN